MDKDTTKSTFNKVLNQFPYEKFLSPSKTPVRTGTSKSYLRPSCSTSCLLLRLPKLIQ